MRCMLVVVLFMFSVTCYAVGQEKIAVKIPGIGPAGDIRKLHGDFKFTEGPADDGRGNLYFSDIPANRIYRIDHAGNLNVFLEPSRSTNGLMFNAAGNLVACEMEGRLVEINTESKEVRVLAEQFKGKRFNAPNDLVIDKSGGIYFTDPRFRAPNPWPQEKEAWYYRDSAGVLTRLGDNLPAPNGILLSIDEKTLYVIPSMQKQMMAYHIVKPGQLDEGKVFCELEQATAEENKGGDGLTLDEQGNLYITSNLGIQVFSPQGKKLGIIPIPEQPANCAFGGPQNKTLYVTARTGLYAIEMDVAGHRIATRKQ
jgi:gluconolactonase